MENQGPNKPNNNPNDHMGVNVDKQNAYAPTGVPVAASTSMPGPGMYPPPQQPYYGESGPPPATGAYPSFGQPAQVDAYGRPVVQAVPIQVQTTRMENNANIRRDGQGNALCNKCSAPYPLPPGCTSWRCRNCHQLNNASIYGDECCLIL